MQITLLIFQGLFCSYREHLVTITFLCTAGQVFICYPNGIIYMQDFFFLTQFTLSRSSSLAHSLMNSLRCFLQQLGSLPALEWLGFGLQIPDPNKEGE